MPAVSTGSATARSDFFLASKSFADEWAACDAAAFDLDNLRASYARFRDRFVSLVPAGLRQDDFNNLEWRQRILSALLARQDDEIYVETLVGLSAEFYMQIEWLPGARIEEGEVIFDTVFEEEAAGAAARGPHVRT